jgi:hypothetical protein
VGGEKSNVSSAMRTGRIRSSTVKLVSFSFVPLSSEMQILSRQRGQRTRWHMHAMVWHAASGWFSWLAPWIVAIDWTHRERRTFVPPGSCPRFMTGCFFVQLA